MIMSSLMKQYRKDRFKKIQQWDSRIADVIISKCLREEFPPIWRLSCYVFQLVGSFKTQLSSIVSNKSQPTVCSGSGYKD